MKKNIFIVSVLFIALSYTGISQEEKSNTIDSQFTELIKSSNTYQSFKVIEISKLGELQKNIRDSIASLKTAIVGSEAVILEQKNEIDSITNKIKTLKVDLEQTQQKVENIEFLGLSTHKTSYNSIMWSIITVLFSVSIILFFVSKRGNSNTKNAQEKLESTEIELDNLRKRSLEREQKVRRELQDEINKNRLKKE